MEPESGDKLWWDECKCVQGYKIAHHQLLQLVENMYRINGGAVGNNTRRWLDLAVNMAMEEKSRAHKVGVVRLDHMYPEGKQDVTKRQYLLVTSIYGEADIPTVPMKRDFAVRKVVHEWDASLELEADNFVSYPCDEHLATALADTMFRSVSLPRSHVRRTLTEPDATGTGG